MEIEERLAGGGRTHSSRVCQRRSVHPLQVSPAICFSSVCTFSPHPCFSNLRSLRSCLLISPLRREAVLSFPLTTPARDILAASFLSISTLSKDPAQNSCLVGESDLVLCAYLFLLSLDHGICDGATAAVRVTVHRRQEGSLVQYN